MESHATEITHFFFGQPFRLTSSPNLVGCSIGRSAGFVPRRTLSKRLTTCR
jgi:hypothetical protein